MRVTDGMIRNRGLSTIQTSMRQVAQSQEQLASGKRFSRISDDPIAAQEVMRASAEQKAIAQYEKNILAVRNRQTIEESVVNAVAGVIEDARQIGLTEGSDTRTAATRLSAKGLIDGMIDHVIALGNTRVGNDFIFAGQSVDAPAFDALGAYQGDLLAWDIEIDTDFRHLPNNNGDRIFIASDMLPALQQLSIDLGANDAVGIRASSERLRDAYEEMQTLLADVGGRTQVTDATESLHADSNAHLTDHRSRLEDVDVASAISALASRQASLNGALVALQKGLELNITALLG